MSLHSIFPDHEAFLALEPEEVAGVVLEYLNSKGDAFGLQLNRYNFTLPGTAEGYPDELKEDILMAIAEGWAWLEREGLIALKPGTQGDWVFITRRGKQVKDREGLKKYRHSDMLPRKLLHPKIAQKVWSAFIRGEYDTAVFQAFKEVEVATREKAKLSDKDIGVDLMRKAFNTENGVLTDLDSLKAEREALQHLFAGAIGSYKNPHSHRNVTISEPEEAVEMIILASHLLKIIDTRAMSSDNP